MISSFRHKQEKERSDWFIAKSSLEYMDFVVLTAEANFDLAEY